MLRQGLAFSLQPAVAPITSAEQDEDALARQAIAWSLQPAVAPITSAEQDKDALVRQAISLSLQPAVAPNASAELDKDDAMKRQAVAFSLQPAVIAGPSVEQHGDASFCQAAISIPAGLGLSHCSRYYARCLWSRCRMLWSSSASSLRMRSAILLCCCSSLWSSDLLKSIERGAVKVSRSSSLVTFVLHQCLSLSHPDPWWRTWSLMAEASPSC